MIDSRRLTPAAAPEAADPAAATRASGGRRPSPAPPSVPAPRPGSRERPAGGAMRGVGKGGDLQPRRADSSEITSAPKAQTGRGPERGEEWGQEEASLHYPARLEAPETAAMQFPAHAHLCAG